jgi:hypothetical protein
MSIETVPGTDLSYSLIAFDAAGRERTDDPDGAMTQAVIHAVRTEPFTDVFLFCHGWMGDVTYAKYQYNNWIRAMAACQPDIERLQSARANFKPLLIGLHWPSRPWGDERLRSAPVSFDTYSAQTDAGAEVAKVVDEYASVLGDSPTVREALQAIVVAARESVGPSASAPELRQAYKVLESEAAPTRGGLNAAPGADRPPFDAEVIISEATETADDTSLSFGLPSLNIDDLLAPLRVLSFWKMKDRARRFGEAGGHGLLTLLSNAAAQRGGRLHLMGHSFGCIVVSAMLAGPRDEGQSIPAASSLLMVQGALSLWSYCSDIPWTPGRAGYFRRLIDRGRVAGPIVTTQSRYDTAVGRFYALGALLAGQVDFAPGQLPEYGGLGTWGIRGPGIDIIDMELLAADRDYPFVSGKVYNLDGSKYICRKEAFSGAHSDIAHSEVAHAVWQAALGTV